MISDSFAHNWAVRPNTPFARGVVRRTTPMPPAAPSKSGPVDAQSAKENPVALA